MPITIKMNQHRPAPHLPGLNTYLAGQTYTLATADEIAMAKGFIAEGAAEEVPTEEPAPEPRAKK